MDFIGPNSMVSYASVGAAIGTVIPGIGTLIGAGIGAIADIATGFSSKKKAKKKLKKAFLEALIKRYHNAIFVSTLERLGEAMMYLMELGLKPGTGDFDMAMRKKLGAELGYEGGCAIKIYGPPPQKQLIAHIDKTGKVIASSGYVDPKLTGEWRKACEELHTEALKAWLENQAVEMEYQREMQAEVDEANRQLLTKVLVNSGVIIFLAAYSARQKRKLRQLRMVTNG